MLDIADYITNILGNPTAAKNLINEIVNKVDKLADFPYVNPLHIFPQPLEYEYRKLIVKSYIVFYWIDESIKKITVGRVIYKRRNYGNMLQ